MQLKYFQPWVPFTLAHKPHVFFFLNSLFRFIRCFFLFILCGVEYFLILISWIRNNEEGSHVDIWSLWLSEKSFKGLKGVCFLVTQVTFVHLLSFFLRKTVIDYALEFYIGLTNLQLNWNIFRPSSVWIQLAPSNIWITLGTFELRLTH
jgi:hypothetical protein